MAHAMLSRLSDAAAEDPGFRLVGVHAHPDWTDALTGVSSWRLAGVHLTGITELGRGISVGDGLVILPPGSLHIETLAATMAGRGITEVIDHPVFDGRMRVTGMNGSARVQCWIAVTGTRVPIAEALEALGTGRRP